MRIYTRTGDQGETSLFGGERVPKDALRVEAAGAIDELNSILGVAVASARHATVRYTLCRIQEDLFVLGADLSGSKEIQIQASHVGALERDIDELDRRLPALRQFILPGGDARAARLHLARAVCRRAERRVVTLARLQPVNPQAVVYLNRLSDLLFVLARWLNRRKRKKEIVWRGSGAKRARS